MDNALVAVSCNSTYMKLAMFTSASMHSILRIERLVVILTVTNYYIWGLCIRDFACYLSMFYCLFYHGRWELYRQADKIGNFLNNATLICSKRCTLLPGSMFNQTPYRLLWEAISQIAVIARRLFVHKYHHSTFFAHGIHS